MPQRSISVNRTLVGIIAVVCLGVGLAMLVVDSTENMWAAALIRVGLVTGAFWIALPSRDREAAWANLSPHTLLAVLLGALVFVSRPRVFLVLFIPLAIIGFFLRPRGRIRTPRERPLRRGPS